MRPGSSSPILPTVFAFLFCFFNGFLQTHVLLYDTMVNQPNFSLFPNHILESRCPEESTNQAYSSCSEFHKY